MLPAELLDMIFDHLENDRKALLKCTLICRPLTSYIRARLFSSKLFYHQCSVDEPCGERSQNILAFAPYMRSLKISQFVGTYESCIVTSWILPAGKFVHLRTLWLSAVTFWSWADFFSTFQSLPAVERLVLSHIKTCGLSSAHSIQRILGSSELPQVPRPGVRPCSRLEELVCNNLDDEAGFVRELLEVRTRIAIEWLELDVSDDGSPELWTPLIHALAPSLQGLIVRTRIKFSRRSAADVLCSFTSFFDGLQECTKLRSLTVGQMASGFFFKRFDPCPAILEALCEFLDRPLRLPQFVRLDFGMFDFNSMTVTGCDWLWERLVHALRNPEKYPQISKLRVQVYVELDMKGYSDEGSRRTEGRWQKLLARHLSNADTQLTCE
ncbi:hypothetical protein K466DRAFT_601420 [Polyporus arcularius HHB13444]|uniref:F-box domain-containing protein n=1 Tax=Polyporus arcularius HHB13444 TaxID=1314778 RepID=A0A5C3PAA5_9APHY|nr:hypothetical protein K466DRAFT_601420 [Polyporus arcularius HHB13444]